MSHTDPQPFIAIACGGTGGHLFPGIAIAHKLQEYGCDIALLISEKEVDRNAVGAAPEWDVITLPAVPLLTGNFLPFLKNSWRSFLVSRRYFKKRKPAAVLAMGGFTSAPPVFAGKLRGAATCLHEANSIPGRANRLLASWVNRAFIGFASASTQLNNRSVKFTGTPVRMQFEPVDPAPCRMALGLDPKAPVLLVMGGSQGASRINSSVIEAIPLLLEKVPDLQFLHLTGQKTFEEISAAYRNLTSRARVLPFLTEMDLALGAASVCISRAGASSLAEIAAMQVPNILIPYPEAADNHQYFNARAFAQQGAARIIPQSLLRPDSLASTVLELLTDSRVIEQMRAELAKWHFADAADQIAAGILELIKREPQPSPSPALLKVSHG